MSYEPAMNGGPLDDSGIGKYDPADTDCPWCGEACRDARDCYEIAKSKEFQRTPKEAQPRPRRAA